MIRSTHHAALGLDDRERGEAIRGAYRDLARRYHPARVGPGGEANFRVIAAAYRILSDSSLRRLHDEARVRGFGGPARQERSSATGSGTARPGAPRLRLPPRRLSLDRAAVLALPRADAMLARFARNFSGVGVPKSESAECLCVRFIIAAEDRGGDVRLHLGLPVLTLCEACGGHGATALVQCCACNGRGLVDSERVLRLTVSATPTDAPNELSLVPLGIHNFYLRAIVRIEPALH